MSIVDNGDQRNIINIIKKNSKEIMDRDPENTENLIFMSQIIQWVNELKYPHLRENALFELSKKRESFPHLAIYLFYTTGTIAIL